MLIETSYSKEIPVSEQLVSLANLKFDFIRSTENLVLALPKSGPKVARYLEGSLHNLGDELVRLYRDIFKKLPSERAVNDALRVINSEVSLQNPQKVYLRFAHLNQAIWIDLGDSTGAAVHIFPGGWKIVDRPPVPFRRTVLTAPMPLPQRGGDLMKLFQVINVPLEIRSLISGFLVASFFERIPRPILAINGEQGSGKSDAERRIGELLDPSPTSLQSPPRDVGTWIEMASNSAVIRLDNISEISVQISDSFCRATTGDSIVKRKLYSDKDLVVHQFRRVIILNGINLTSLRDDLLDRIVPISLPVISPENRIYEETLEELWEENHSQILGGLFDLCANVLEELPEIILATRPRMADFAKILAAHDKVASSNSLEIYLGLIDSSASSAIENDKFLTAISRHITSSWKGSANDLLEFINSREPYHFDKEWPNTPKKVTERLVRSAPTLRKVGWEVDNLGASNKEKVTVWRVKPTAG